MASPASTSLVFPSVTDPLGRLGPELFVEILSGLSARELLVAERVSRSWNDCAQAYASGLWRRISLRCGVEPSDIRKCDNLAQTGCWSANVHDRRGILGGDDVPMLLAPPPIHEWADRFGDTPTMTPLQTPLPTPGLHPVRVNWRHVCKTYVELQNAWSTARCRLRWITPPFNMVWRIKSNMEQDVILCTSRRSGLVVVDRYTSEPLFEIQDLESGAHLEAGRGYAVFNTPGHVAPDIGLGFDEANSNTAFEVWRTEEARARSDLPYVGVSSVAASAHSFTHLDEFEPDVRNGFLPRGHLEHFCTLQPPESCHAFRLHVDRADSEDAQAVFAAASRTAIYIFYLEETRPMEKIEREYLERGRPNYIELDDNFVWVCLDKCVSMYSRKTLKHIVSYPPPSMPGEDTVAMAFPLSLTDDFKSIPDEERVRENPEATRDGRPAPIGRANVTGAYKGEPAFEQAIKRGTAMHPIQIRLDQTSDIEYCFTAVHFTSTDLICTAESGAVFIIRHYADVLNACLELDKDERGAFVAKHTFMIGLGTTIRQLTTYRDHIVICTSFNIILIEGKHLPEIGQENPTLRAHLLLGNHPQAMKFSSCIQADARSIYMTYWATGEVDAVGGSHPHNVSFPTNDALEGFGMCIKTWTFGPE